VRVLVRQVIVVLPPQPPRAVLAQLQHTAHRLGRPLDVDRELRRACRSSPAAPTSPSAAATATATATPSPLAAIAVLVGERRLVLVLFPLPDAAGLVHRTSLVLDGGPIGRPAPHMRGMAVIGGTPGASHGDALGCWISRRKRRMHPPRGHEPRTPSGARSLRRSLAAIVTSTSR